MAELLFLSPSRIGTFRQCPLKYAYDVDREIRQAWRQPKSYFFTGNSLHTTLRELYRRGGPAAVTWPQLSQLYRSTWEGLDWQSQGFADRAQAEEAFYQGRESLKRYWEQRQNEKSNPILIEQGLSWTLGNARLYGRIDRLERHPDGTFEVIDYKTGKSFLTPEELAADEQVNLYYYLVAKRFQPERVILSHHYLQEHEVVSVEPTLTLAEIEADLQGVAAEIQGLEQFLPTRNRLCDWCDYAPLCPAVQGQVELTRLAETAAQRPDLAPLQLRLAQVYRERGEPAAALEVLSRLLQSWPDPQAYWLRGLTLAELGDWAAAVADLQLGPEGPQRELWVARATFEQGQFSEALAALVQLTEAEELHPDAQLEAELLVAASQKALGLLADAQATLEGLVRRYPGAWQVRLELCSLYLALGDLSRAEAEWWAAQRHAPTAEPKLYLVGAELYQAAGDLQEALACFGQAAPHLPEGAWATYAEVARQAGDYRALKEALEGYLPLQPEAEPLHEELFHCYLHLGELDQAEPIYRGLLERRRRRRDLIGQVALAEAYLQVAPAEPQPLADLAEAAAALGRATQAAEALITLARLARVSGDLAQAQAYLKRVVALAPDHEALAEEQRLLLQVRARTRAVGLE